MYRNISIEFNPYDSTNVPGEIILRVVIAENFLFTRRHLSGSTENISAIVEKEDGREIKIEASRQLNFSELPS